MGNLVLSELRINQAKDTIHLTIKTESGDGFEIFKYYIDVSLQELVGQ